MPIPFVFIAIGAISGAFGVGKTVKAGVDTHTAKKVTDEANTILKNAKRRLNRARRQSGKSLEELGRCKVNVLDSSINRFVKSFEKIKNIELKETDGLLEVNKLKLDKQAIKELKEMGGFATSILSGVAGGAIGGALTAFGAYSAAGAFAAASTGTLISSLSGVAATNATLAFFGGGSIAAGGLGMAGGTAVLGGLVAGPALAIIGLIVGAKASKVKDEAYANLAIAQKNAKEMDLAAALCRAISKRSKMFCDLLNDLDLRFKPILEGMEETIRTYGTDYSRYPLDNRKNIAAAMALAVSIKATLDTPILTKDGQLTSESAALLEERTQTAQAKKRANNKKTPEGELLPLRDIVMKCSSGRHDMDNKPKGHPETYGVYGRISWGDLLRAVNNSFGTRIDEKSAGTALDGYGKNDPVGLWSLEDQLARLINYCQVGEIVQSCSSVDILNSMIVSANSIDWQRLAEKIKQYYGKSMAQWQLTAGKESSGNIPTNSIIDAITTKVSNGNESEYRHLLFHDVFSKAVV